MPDDEIRDRYAELASVYIDMFGAEEHVAPDDLDFVRRSFARCDGRILDIGCGPGHLTAFLAGLGHAAQGVDLVPAFIDHAHANWPDIEFTVASMTNLAAPPDSMSGLLAWYSLIHCEPAELATILAGFRRVIRPGGTFVVGFFDGESVEPFAHKVVTAYRWPVGEMARVLATAGFVETERMRRAGTDQVRSHAALAVRAI